MHPLTIPDTTLSNTQKISPHLLPTHLSISAEALRVTPDRPSIQHLIIDEPPIGPTFTSPKRNSQLTAILSHLPPFPSRLTQTHYLVTLIHGHLFGPSASHATRITIPDNPAPSPRNPHHPHDYVLLMHNCAQSSSNSTKGPENFLTALCLLQPTQQRPHGDALPR